MNRGDRKFFMAASGLVLSALFLGMALVWLNIEAYDVAYDLKQFEARHKMLMESSAKLEIERDNLVSPYRLRSLAQDFGLEPAGAGQIRRMDDGAATDVAQNDRGREPGGVQ